MCGRFTVVDWDAVARRFQLSLGGWDLRPRYNVAPTQPVMTIRRDGARNRAEMMRWGLVPPWAKDIRIGSRMINARAETLAERPSFRAAFRRRRCLVAADGFYEWGRQGGRRTPTRFTLESGEPFAFAGIWEMWRQPDGGALLSCAIATTRANEIVAPIHDRMPVILPPEREAMWMDPSVEDTDALSDLLEPLAAERMTAYEVSTIVNSAANDSQECIMPAARML